MEQTDLRLSIVVNMYNTASFLPRCMDTLLHQDISPDSYEIILVDDGSTDNSLALAQEYAAKSMLDATMPTIRVEHHANKGLAGARNTGLRAAKGQYLCFVDPDDYIQKNSLLALLQKMKVENLDVLRFDYQRVDEYGNMLQNSHMEQSFDYTSQIMTGIEFMQKRLTTLCYVWTYLFRLDMIKKNNIYFDESCYFDDVPWLPRILSLAERLSCINICHVYYTQRNGSLVNTVNIEAIKRKIDGQIKVLEILNTHRINIEILPWYQTMRAHLVVSILTNISIHLYQQRKEYLERIQLLKLYPLILHHPVINNKLKIYLINLSPKLFVWLINKKNR